MLQIQTRWERAINVYEMKRATDMFEMDRATETNEMERVSKAAYLYEMKYPSSATGVYEIGTGWDTDGMLLRRKGVPARHKCIVRLLSTCRARSE